MSVEQRVKEVTARVLHVSIDDVTPEKNFSEDLGAQSVQSIELVAAFEEEFDIEMDEDEALAVETVGSAVEFIKNYVDET